jgi:hypothetical protein
MRRSLPLVLLLAVAACAPASPSAPPAAPARVVTAAPDVVLERLRGAMTDLGLTVSNPAPMTLLGWRAAGDPAGAADCAAQVVWDRSNQNVRADFAQAEQISSEIEAVVEAAGAGRPVERHSTLNRGYHNIFINRPFLEACRSTGQLESRLLDAASSG